MKSEVITNKIKLKSIQPIGRTVQDASYSGLKILKKPVKYKQKKNKHFQHFY